MSGTDKAPFRVTIFLEWPKGKQFKEGQSQATGTNLAVRLCEDWHYHVYGATNEATKADAWDYHPGDVGNGDYVNFQRSLLTGNGVSSAYYHHIRNEVEKLTGVRPTLWLAFALENDAFGWTEKTGDNSVQTLMAFGPIEGIPENGS